MDGHRRMLSQLFADRDALGRFHPRSTPQSLHVRASSRYTSLVCTYIYTLQTERERERERERVVK